MASESVVLLLALTVLSSWGNEAADLQVCVDNFVVHADKIIRTQDSRALGAKYLTEADVPSKEDCLQMCCETPSCDVFVFEHKRGSCYLFHCGDPQDFKCKFTQHRNYSSGVLMPPNELETQIKLTKHEQELAQLSRQKVENVETAVPVAAAAAAPSAETTSHPQLLTTAKPPPAAKVNVSTHNQCSRYQFECRTSHECIAIYNACDGIAQCPDGSDEAPELDCPTLTGTVRPFHPHRKQLPVPKEILTTNDVKKSFPMHPQPPYTPYDEKQESLQALEAQEELINHVKNYGREGEGAGQEPATVYRAYPPQIPKQQEEPSRIFNHKGGLIAEGEISNPMPPFANDPNRAEYQKPPNPASFYNGDYQKGAPGSGYYNGAPYPQYNWPMRQRDDPRWQYPGPPPPADYYYEESQVRLRPPSAQNERAPNTPPLVAATIPPGKLAEADKTTLTKIEEGKEKLKETVSVKKVIVESTVAPKTVAGTSTQPAPSHDRLTANEDEFVVVDSDGENERPRGALLSLGLGMCIAAIMITLVGCRLRVVQRRLRRGGKPYAHDADFLVNGMYL